MHCLKVSLPQAAYSIVIGDGILSRIADGLANSKKKLLLVTDQTVWALHGTALAQAIKARGGHLYKVILPPGEAEKTLQSLTTVWAACADHQLTRQDLLIAFGGGVIGDVTGFAAATWMRGTGFVQIPTTLLAQVDAAVGGKTAVNLPAGKNLVGTFHQPTCVFADTGYLDTLPAVELRNGMAEAIKYGAILSATLFERLSAPQTRQALPDLVADCCRLKADLVAADERDTGARMLLNFGHTFGHAIEKLGDYRRHRHGEAVAMGMVLAAQFGEHLGFTKPHCAEKIRQTLARHSLPTACPYEPADLFAGMNLDKKRSGDTVRLILLADIGEAAVVPCTLPELERVLLTLSSKD